MEIIKITKSQRLILIQLTLIYYAAGDVKDAYEEDIREELVKAFKIPDTDDAIHEILERFESIYTDWESSLKLSTKDFYKSDELAADLYLEYWRATELPNNPNDRNYIGPEKQKELEERNEEIRKELGSMDYPDPSTIVYDNDSNPMVKWKNPRFDSQAYYDWCADGFQ